MSTDAVFRRLVFRQKRTIPAGPPFWRDNPILKKEYGQDEFVINPKQVNASVPNSRWFQVRFSILTVCLAWSTWGKTYAELLELVHQRHFSDVVRRSLLDAILPRAVNGRNLVRISARPRCFNLHFAGRGGCQAVRYGERRR